LIQKIDADPYMNDLQIKIAYGKVQHGKHIMLGTQGRKYNKYKKQSFLSRQ